MLANLPSKSMDTEKIAHKVELIRNNNINFGEEEIDLCIRSFFPPERSAI